MDQQLVRLRLGKKFTLSIIDENKPEIKGMLVRVKDFVAFGKIDEKTLIELLKHRGKKIGNVKAKISEAEAIKVAKEIMNGKSLEEFGIKPWIGLHPARGGIETKLHYPRGVLGDHKEKINELIKRML